MPRTASGLVRRAITVSIESWLAGNSGDWTLASDWSGGKAPGAADTAVIAAPGAYVVTLFGAAAVGGVTLNAAGAEFYDAGVLSLSGTFALQAGTLALAYGSINGGTLALQGGHFQTTGGTLDAVAVQGALDLSTAGATLFVRDGMAMSGAGGIGAGSIALTGAYAALDFLGSQTLNNATITLGGTGAVAGQAGAATLGIFHPGGAVTGATLTLGSTLWLRQSGYAGVSGIIAVGSAGVLGGATLPDALINQGTITAAIAGATLDVTGSGTFVNAGMIAVSNGATLEIATAGFANTGTIAVNNATLALGGMFASTLLGSLGALTLSTGVVEIIGTAGNTGLTLALGTGSALGTLLGPISLAGTILGGTISDGGGGLSFGSATGVLDGATYAGTLNLSATNAAVTLTDGARVTAPGGGPGSILDTGAGASLLLRGSEVLDYATISLGSSGPAAASIGTTDVWLASAGTTATLGAHLTVQQTRANAALTANGWSPVPGLGVSDLLINAGSIVGAVAGGRLSVSGYGTFINQGYMTIAGGDTLAVTVSQFANTGTILAGYGGTLLLGQPAGAFGNASAWSNAGVIDVAGGTLVLAGSVQTGQLGTIVQTAGSVQLAGTLVNAGATLSLGVRGGPLTLTGLSLSGTIAGGTILDAAGVLSAGTTGTALLDGVSYVGTLALTTAGSFLRVRDGLALSGVADVLGAGSVLDFVGSQTLDHAQILLGAAGSAAALDLTHDPSVFGTQTLALGAGLVVTQAGALATIGRPGGTIGDQIVSGATINAAIAGGTFTLGGSNFINQGHINVSNGDTLAIAAGGFSNYGSITVSGGVLSLTGSLTLAGLGQVFLSNSLMSVSGTLDLSGSTLQIGTGTNIGHISLTGTLRGGTIVDAGGGLALAGEATLDGVAYQGVLDLSRPFARLAVADGLTVAALGGIQPGSILVTGAQSRLIATTSETFDNAVILLGSVAQYYNGQKLAAPELAGTPGVQINFGAHSTVMLAGTAGVLGDAGLGQWNDRIVNAGQIIAGNPLGALFVNTSFFSNTGVMTASGGGILVFSNVYGTNAGVISIGAGSAMQVMLYDYYAAPNAGPGVFTNSGTIAINGGILQEPTANGLFPAVPIANVASGDIAGNGLVFAQIANSGTIEARGGTLLLVDPVLGTGIVQIDAGSTLELQTTFTSAQSVHFAGSAATLKLDTPSSFTATLSGVATGDMLDFPSLILTGVGISSGTLVVSTATANYRFVSATPLGGAVTAGRDAHGGAVVSVILQAPGGGAVAAIAASQPNMLFWASPVGDAIAGIAANVNGAHVSNWSQTDSIDIVDMAPALATLSMVQSAGLATLSLSDGTHSSSVGLTGTFAASSFHLSPDNHGGTMLTFHG